MSSRRRRDTDNMSNNKPSTETPPLGIRNGLLSSGSTVGLKSASSNIRYRLLCLLGAVFAGIATYQSRILSVRHLGHAATQLPESYALCTDPGKVYTVDEVKPNVDCMLVRRDRIMATGSLEDVEAEWDVYQNELIAKFYGNELKAKKPLKVLNTPTGSIVIPGLADAHAHLIQYGFKMQLQLDGADTLEDVLDRVEAYIKAHPDVHADHDRWIEGYGWDQTRWNGWRGGFPTAADLATRPILASRPLSLFRVDSHALWISPRALELVQAQLPHGKFPEPGELKGGEVVRDDQGEPTGVFVDAAMALVPVPPWSQRQMEEYFQRAVKDALRVGLTSVHDAAATPEIIDVFRKMADEGQLPIRIYAMGNSESTEYWGSTIPRLENYGKDGRLNLRSVKLFTDGALGSWGAALLEPYSDNPSTSGLMRSSEQALAEIVKRFWDDGWGVNIHCIGDRANKAVLDIFEGLLANSSRTAEERRPRIEHAQIMRPEDLKRAGRLGVITSVQPTHA
ncbi:hypothetical protein AcW1_002156 [Taiwanofungus camphoratus]|nr:hypothetical protein AcV5_010147 [Antrodia cinnamomea]KAI0944448.1 hypothetical protein AcW1_002156 [Antrodia cinnamomea]KAI0946106.1 hypothetical protein AcV7_010167 [Antrodia cinnamomea]